VVAAVVVLALVAGTLWRIESERERGERERERAERPGREIVLRNTAGEVLGQARLRDARVPGQGPEFQVPMKDGSTLIVQLPRPDGMPGRMGPPAGGRMGEADAMHLPFGFAWMLGLVALAVAVGTYPVVRRLTKRLEGVQQGVERWGAGDLSTRLAEDGDDEVAFLAKRFNHSAQQIETLLTRQKKLLESQKSLLANASHELRSPLARIRMGLELMVNPSATLKDEIARNIAELDQLIDEILLASRLDAHEADMGTVESLDLTGLAAEECARCGADLQLENPPAELIVSGVNKLLRRAVRNLLENARRHAAGNITLSLQRELKNGVQHAVIKVSDHGPGVPPELAERIFEPFYRLPGASEQGGGVGLGLALVKAIAIRHGGTVLCQNQAGGGACFVLTLPLVGV
jgi:signal transduction histidine kinase